MDQNSEPFAGSTQASEPIRPSTLTALLGQKEAKVGAFFDDLTQLKLAWPGQSDLDAGLEVVKADPSLLGRVAEIARNASEIEHSRLSQPILDWCADALRASSADLAEWMRIAGSDPHGQLRQLAIKLQSAKEKPDKAAAEARLAIGMSVLMRKFALAPEDALRAVASSLEKGGDKLEAQKKSEERARLGKVLRRAGAGQLTNLAIVVRLLDEKVVDAHQKMRDAQTARQELYDKNLKLKGDLDVASAKIGDLAAERDQLRDDIAKLRAEIQGVKGDADHGEIELKARYRTLLLRRLRPYLSDAAEALQIEPPYPDVASERVKLALSEIAKEQEWLDRS